MDFELHDTPEMAAFRLEVRASLKNAIPSDLVISPYAEDIGPAQLEKRREVGRHLGSSGWLYPTWPKQYGGGGLIADHAIVSEQEMDEHELGMPPYYDPGGHPGEADILVWGTEQQKQTFLKPMVRGEWITWQLLTEPHGGSDLASTKTMAIRDGDEYVVNGTKTFVGSFESKPDYLWTIVLTDPTGPRHQNLSWLMIPADTPGITIHALDLLSGISPTEEKCSVFLEDVRVPAFSLVGRENNGWKVANTHLELEHGAGGSVRGNRHVERFLKYCEASHFDGRLTRNDPDVRDLVPTFINPRNVV